MVSRGTSDLLVNLGIVVLVIVVIYFVIIRNPNALNWLKGSKVGAAAIGATVPGPNVYPVVGPALTNGIITIRSSGTSFRDNQGYDCSKCNRESTWFFNAGGSGDVSIKMGAHGDESDATSLIQYSTDGQKWRCEGPHMPYNDLSGSGTVDVGSGNIGIKGISWNVSGAGNNRLSYIDHLSNP